MVISFWYVEYKVNLFDFFFLINKRTLSVWKMKDLQKFKNKVAKYSHLAKYGSLVYASLKNNNGKPKRITTHDGSWGSHWWMNSYHYTVVGATVTAHDSFCIPHSINKKLQKQGFCDVTLPNRIVVYKAGHSNYLYIDATPKSIWRPVASNSRQIHLPFSANWQETTRAYFDLSHVSVESDHHVVISWRILTLLSRTRSLSGERMSKILYGLMSPFPYELWGKCFLEFDY